MLRGNSRRCTQESLLASLGPYRMLGFECGLHIPYLPYLLYYPSSPSRSESYCLAEVCLPVCGAFSCLPAHSLFLPGPLWLSGPLGTSSKCRPYLIRLGWVQIPWCHLPVLCLGFPQHLFQGHFQFPSSSQSPFALQGAETYWKKRM